VVYEGDGFNAIGGTHHAPPLEQGALRALAQRMLDARWFGLEDQYRARLTDSPTQIVTLTVDGLTKKVIDYVGIRAGMPDAVQDIEHEIDVVAGSGRWVRAESGLASLLHAEGFDFESFEAQSALRTAASHGDVTGVRELLAAGVPRERVSGPAESPTLGRSWNGFEGLLTAAARQPDVLRVMMDAGVGSQDAIDKNVALTAAVSSGNADAARLLMRYGGDIHMNFAALQSQTGASAYWIKDSPGLLVSAIRSGDPETVQFVLAQLPLNDLQSSNGRGLLVELAATGNKEQSERRAECARLLLKAGADVHGTDDRGRTALHVAQGLPLVTLLVQAGANVNAQDGDGNTPVFSTYDPEIFRFLVAHGADLTIRNHAGQTAMENPQRYAPEWVPVYAEVRVAQAVK
jgi:Ankyrin repeats (3 copies)